MYSCWNTTTPIQPSFPRLPLHIVFLVFVAVHDVHPIAVFASPSSQASPRCRLSPLPPLPQLCDIMKQKLLLSPDYTVEFCEAVSFIEFLSDSMESAANTFAGAAAAAAAGVGSSHDFEILADNGLVDYFVSLLHTSGHQQTCACGHVAVLIFLSCCDFVHVPAIILYPHHHFNSTVTAPPCLYPIPFSPCRVLQLGPVSNA